MKNTKCLKDLLKQATFVTAIFATSFSLFTSCTNDRNTKDSKAIAEKQNDTNFDNKEKKNDAQFLVNAAEINLKEIFLGQLAQKKGKSSHIKELGRKMEEVHSQSQKELASLAKSKSINIPTSPSDKTKDTYSKLNKESADDFDKAYADKMVDGHKEAIDVYQSASKEVNDPAIKKWAINSLPNLHNHLNHSIKCQRKCKS